MKMICIVVAALIILSLLLRSEAQQSYVNNKQLDCYNNFNVTDGFECNGARPSCLSYLTFRPIHPYDTPTAIAHLLSSDASSIAAANNISSEFDTIPADIPMVVVPVNCSCRRHQQHEASYSLQVATETYFSVANNTYQGLTTCQALMAANPSHNSRNLSAGLALRVPLRCACPTPLQAAAGVRLLLSYLVTWNDDIPSISRLFGVKNPQSVREANRLSPTDIIFPFTDILLPLEAPLPPGWLRLGGGGAPPPAAAAPPPPPPTTQSPSSPKPSNKKWVAVGVAIGGAALLVISATFVFCFIVRRRRSKQPPRPPFLPPPSAKEAAHSGNETQYSTDTSSFSRSSPGIRSAVDSLTFYTILEVRDATGSFDDAHKIAGSVFRGSFKGDAAAVKVMKGDVSAEIGILKQINHSNIVRLSGFCVNGGNTYLVYEHAESGSLAEALSSSKPRPHLGWTQRVEIAHGLADALNYLHNFAHPPYVHANVNSSNVLLDADFRAKLSNFKLARSLGHRGEAGHGGIHLTRHVVGTQGYLAPEYIENGLVTPKLDVFAMGVVLLELLSGREAAATKKDTELLSNSIRRIMEGDGVRQKLREFMDPALGEKYPLDLAFSMAQLAEICVSPDLNARPDISQVFVTLSKILSSTNDWDPSDEVDRSSSLTDGR